MIQKLIFTAGMNLDDAPEFLKEGESRNRINVRVLSSDGDQRMSAETMKGNTLVSYSLPAGTNKVIGTKEDKTRSLIYCFVYNSGNHHLILEYNIVTNAIVKVIQEAASAPYFLDFDIDHLITGVVIVELDSTNHLIYWTDYHTEPKKLNIEKAKYFSAGDFVNGYKSPFDPEIAYRIKKPQLYPPTYVWANDSSQKINYLFKKLFVFKVQFLYDDKDISSWSPISKYVMPTTTSDGQSGEDLGTQYNKVTITVQTGSSIVTKIRIAAKESATNDFKLIAELDKAKLNIADNTTYNFDFYNNGNYVILEINESIKLFDNIPFLSQAEDSIENSRIVDANIVEGIDPVNIDMRLPVSYVAAPMTSNIFFPSDSYLKGGGGYKTGIVYYDEKGNRSGTTNITDGKTTGSPSDALIYDRYGTTLYLPFETDPMCNPPRVAPYRGLNYVPQVGVQIYNAPPSDTNITHYQILRSKNETMDRYIWFVAQNVVYTALDQTSIVAPSVAAYIRVDIGNIIGRYKTENPNSQLVYDFVKGDRIRFIANNDWATLTPSVGFLAPVGGNWSSYSVAIGSAGENTLDALFSFNDNEIVSYDPATGQLYVKMNSTIPDNLWPGVVFEIYQPAENVIGNNELMYEMGECRAITTDAYGNRVHDGTLPQKFVAFSSSSFVGSVYTLVVPAGHGLLATQSIKFYNAGYSVYGVISSVTATTVVVNITGFTIVGFYTSAAGTISRAAIFNLSGGDSFKRYQDSPLVTPAVNRVYTWVDCENASNMFASKAWDVGRPNRIDPLYRRIARTTTGYFSEKFIPETNINGLSTVYDTSFQSYDPRFGSIQRVYYENHRLIVFQELKVGEVPVQQIIYNDLQLNDSVGASTVVLSPNIVYYMGEFGIGKNPESFAVYAQAKYFIDVRRGALLRLSTDGLTSISETANMHNYFTDKCTQILSVGTNPKIYGVYDPLFQEYIISFEVIGGVPGETIAFNEATNAFSSFYSYLPEFMCGANNNIVTFKNGSLYTHNTNSTYCNFYGVQYESELWVVLNADPSNVKILQSIAEETLVPWEVYSITTPSGQETNLAVTDFTDLEGQQYSPVGKDINTPNITPPALPIFEGDPMRSTTFICKFRYPGTDYNKIFAVDLRYIISNLHNR